MSLQHLVLSPSLSSLLPGGLDTSAARAAARAAVLVLVSTPCALVHTHHVVIVLYLTPRALGLVHTVPPRALGFVHISNVVMALYFMLPALAI